MYKKVLIKKIHKYTLKSAKKTVILHVFLAGLLIYTWVERKIRPAKACRIMKKIEPYDNVHLIIVHINLKNIDFIILNYKIKKNHRFSN
jgi:hypothetical protein